MPKLRKLPTTPDEFDNLVLDVVEEYGFTDVNHAAVLTAQAICHTPVECSEIAMTAIRDRIIRSLAYKVAETKGKELRDTSYLQELVKLVESDPTNQQALDEIGKAAANGFKLAIEAYDKLTNGKE
jgi:hypothetical protein